MLTSLFVVVFFVTDVLFIYLFEREILICVMFLDLGPKMAPKNRFRALPPLASSLVRPCSARGVFESDRVGSLLAPF